MSSNLASEVTRAEGAETTLTSNLAGEVTRAEGAENGVVGQNQPHGDATLGTAEAFTTSVVTAEGARTLASTNLGNEDDASGRAEALKANLAGGNVFTTGSQTMAAARRDMRR